MLSHASRIQLAQILQDLGELEKCLEVLREILCEQNRFDPYLLFNYLDKKHKQYIDAQDVARFLADNEKFYDEDMCNLFINQYSGIKNGKSSYLQ